MNLEQLQQLVRVQGELATIEALHRENETYREALEEIARLERVSAADRAVNVAGQVAREALDAAATSATKRPDA